MIEISNTLSRFANSFDEKDWPKMASTLADRIAVDYSDLRGTKEVVTRSQYVSMRQKALENLRTHHLLSNLELSEQRGKARCRASGLIFRFLADRFFHSHAIYDFELRYDESRWQITSITQSVLWHEGDPGIHSGVARQPSTE